MTTDRASFAEYLEPEIETMPRPALVALQDERLQHQIHYAYERSALIRSTWDAVGVQPRDVRNRADFVALAPSFDKDAVRDFRTTHNDPYGGLLAVPLGELFHIGTTSGTTGNATPLPRGPWSPEEIGRARDLWEVGARPGDAAVLWLFTFRSGLDGLVEPAPDMGVTRIFLSHIPAEVPRFFEALRRFGPTTVFLFTNPMIRAIDQYATEQGLDVRSEFAGLDGVFYGGEPLGRFSRRKLEEWGLRSHMQTALGDVCGATECVELDGCHTWEDLVLVEVLEPGTNDPVPDGELGELVVTALTDPAAPLIRYRSGDLVRVNSAPCGCGRTHARLKPLGRAGDQTIVAGRAVVPNDVWSLVDTHPATEMGLFQIVRPTRQLDTLRLRVGYEPALLGPAGTAGLQSDLTDVVHAALDVPVEIEMITNAELLELGPPQKIPRVSAT